MRIAQKSYYGSVVTSCVHLTDTRSFGIGEEDEAMMSMTSTHKSLTNVPRRYITAIDTDTDNPSRAGGLHRRFPCRRRDVACAHI